MVLVSDVDYNSIILNKNDDIKCYYNKKYTKDILEDMKCISEENWYPVKARIIKECKEYMHDQFNEDIEESDISFRPLIYIEPCAQWKAPVKIIVHGSYEFDLMFKIYNASVFDIAMLTKLCL